MTYYHSCTIYKSFEDVIADVEENTMDKIVHFEIPFDDKARVTDSEGNVVGIVDHSK